MKHIKKFENLNNINIQDGDYIIWVDNRIDVEILEVTRSEITPNGSRYWSRIIYTYTEEKGLVYLNQSAEAFFRDSDFESIRYVSTSLKDCIKNLDVVIAEDKYNL
jgi:hypothetical protein